jgi:hypothetical protein
MPIEMTGEEKKAYEEFKIFQQKVIAQLEKERPEDLRDLMNPPPKKMAAYDSIIVTYFPFALWLCRFDDMMTRPLTVRINSYRFQRNRHGDEVMEQLGNIRGQRSGRALFDEIDSLGRKLYIYPFWKFANWPKKNPMFRPLGDNSTAKKIGNRDEKGRADAAIEYSASMWGESKVDPKTNLPTGTSGVTGAASEADDVLFHERCAVTRSPPKPSIRTMTTRRSFSRSCCAMSFWRKRGNANSAPITTATLNLPIPRDFSPMPSV